MEVVDVVVLLGPPGSGKSAIGEELGRRGLRWRDWEGYILERWGSRERFIVDKAESLAALHDEVLEWIAAEPSVAVIETTGLSDAPLLATLEGSGAALVVRLDVSEPEALRRVQARPQGHHLSDEVQANRSIWRACEAQRDQREVHLVIDTESTSVHEAADALLALVARRR